MDHEIFDAFFGAMKIKFKGTALVSICEDLKCDLRVYISEKMELKGFPFRQ